MQNPRLVVFLGFILIFSFGFSGTPARAAAPGFSIAAANTTLTASGTGSATFTLTSLNGFTGMVAVTCDSQNQPPEVRLPYCGVGPLLAYNLTAGEAVNGSIAFSAVPVPGAAGAAKRTDRTPAAGLALAGAMLFGLSLRRRARRWLMLTVLAVGALAGFAGISACSADQVGLTPGTYPYTIFATDVSTSAQVSSTFNVTVP
jgi:hypothetical protein